MASRRAPDRHAAAPLPAMRAAVGLPDLLACHACLQPARTHWAAAARAWRASCWSQRTGSSRQQTTHRCQPPCRSGPGLRSAPPSPPCRTARRKPPSLPPASCGSQRLRPRLGRGRRQPQGWPAGRLGLRREAAGPMPPLCCHTIDVPNLLQHTSAHSKAGRRALHHPCCSAPGAAAPAGMRRRLAERPSAPVCTTSACPTAHSAST